MCIPALLAKDHLQALEFLCRMVDMYVRVCSRLWLWCRGALCRGWRKTKNDLTVLLGWGNTAPRTSFLAITWDSLFYVFGVLCAVCVVCAGLSGVFLFHQMPLFTNVDDLMTSWDRLETDAGSEPKSPTVQVGQVL